jgi:multidrug efflux pump subunit AcrB
MIAMPISIAFAAFNRLFDRLSDAYAAVTARLIKARIVLLVFYAVLIFFAVDLLNKTPTGLMPKLDRGYLIAAFQLPPGASLDRTDRVLKQASEMILDSEGVERTDAFVGYDGATFTNATNTGVIFVVLKPFEQRTKQGLSGDVIHADLQKKLSAADLCGYRQD